MHQHWIFAPQLPAVVYQRRCSISSKDRLTFIKNTLFLKHADHSLNLQDVLLLKSWVSFDEGDGLIMAVAERESGYDNLKNSAVKFYVIKSFTMDFSALCVLFLKTQFLQQNFFQN